METWGCCCRRGTENLKNTNKNDSSVPSYKKKKKRSKTKSIECEDPVSMTSEVAYDRLDPKEYSDGRLFLSIYVKDAKIPNDAKDEELCLSVELFFGEGSEYNQKQKIIGRAPEAPTNDGKWRRIERVVIFEERFDFILEIGQIPICGRIKLSFDKSDNDVEYLQTGVSKLPSPIGERDKWKFRNMTKMSKLDGCRVSYEYCWRTLRSDSRRDDYIATYANYETLIQLEIQEVSMINQTEEMYIQIGYDGKRFKTNPFSSSDTKYKQRCFFWRSRLRPELTPNKIKFSLRKKGQVEGEATYDIKNLEDEIRKRTEKIEFANGTSLSVIIRITSKKNLEKCFYKDMYTWATKQMQEVSTAQIHVAYMMGLVAGDIPQRNLEWIFAKVKDSRYYGDKLIKFLRRAQAVVLVGIPYFVYKFPSRVRIQGGSAAQAVMTGGEMIKYRKNGKVEHESVPNYVYGALKAMKTDQTRSVELLKKVSVSGAGDKNKKAMMDNENKKSVQRMIKAFQKLYGIKCDPSKFNTFNDFFVRDEPSRSSLNMDVKSVSSPANCRMMVFASVSRAKDLWIKGKKFNIENLLPGDDNLSDFQDCAICICRLSPQDSHQFYLPVFAETLCEMQLNISTKNLMPIIPVVVNDQDVDVYTENVRKAIRIEAKARNTIYFVAIGSAFVGSIEFENPLPKNKGSKLGKFQYGGSTIILLFKNEKIKFTTELNENSRENIETYIKMGDTIGELI